jgi:hypothetical protein
MSVTYHNLISLHSLGGITPVGPKPGHAPEFSRSSKGGFSSGRRSGANLHRAGAGAAGVRVCSVGDYLTRSRREAKTTNVVV